MSCDPLHVSDAERALLAKPTWSTDELITLAYLARRLAYAIPLPAIADRRYHVSRRLSQALEVHYLPDTARVRAARELLREELAREPADADEAERLEFRAAALGTFEAAIACEAP